MSLESRPLAICVLGGTGFVGTALVTRLATARHRLRVVTRRAANAQHLAVLPTVEIVSGDVHDSDFLSRALAGMDVVDRIMPGDMIRKAWVLPSRDTLRRVGGRAG
jgi:nucleoside-diphosphate-sugar epimerase